MYRFCCTVHKILITNGKEWLNNIHPGKCKVRSQNKVHWSARPFGEKWSAFRTCGTTMVYGTVCLCVCVSVQMHIEQFVVENLNEHRKGILGKTMPVSHMLSWTKVCQTVSVPTSWVYFRCQFWLRDCFPVVTFYIPIEFHEYISSGGWVIGFGRKFKILAVRYIVISFSNGRPVTTHEVFLSTGSFC